MDKGERIKYRHIKNVRSKMIMNGRKKMKHYEKSARQRKEKNK